MCSTGNEFIVDGSYKEIIYEIENELRDENNGIFRNKLSDTQIKTCAEMTAFYFILIQQEESIDDKSKYERGIIIPEKRYYVKIDHALLMAIAGAIGYLLSIAAQAADPAAGWLSTLSTSLVSIGSLQAFEIFKKIPEEYFCVLVCAHHNKQRDLISVKDIEDHLHMKECPYMNIYKTAYGHFCKKHSSGGKCPLSDEHIKTALNALGLDFGVTEIVENLLYKVE